MVRRPDLHEGRVESPQGVDELQEGGEAGQEGRGGVFEVGRGAVEVRVQEERGRSRCADGRGEDRVDRGLLRARPDHGEPEGRGLGAGGVPAHADEHGVVADGLGRAVLEGLEVRGTG